MPVPLLALGTVLGTLGVGATGRGVKRMTNAKHTMEKAEGRNRENLERLKITNEKTVEIMDRLGKREMEILSSFEDFADLMSRIHSRPKFEEIDLGDVKMPKYEPEELKKVSVGAGVLLSGLGGAVAGTAGGFAAAGATTSAVIALGTASTGTAIASLSGAAATNATLAALGGGAIAAGGGGIALGTTVLGVSTLGVGLLVGGIIFNLTGSKLSSRVGEAWEQVLKTEKDIDKICGHLHTLIGTSKEFFYYLDGVATVYERYLKKVQLLVKDRTNINWNDLNADEKLYVQNAVLLVGLLYQMCKVKLVIRDESKNTVNKVNSEEANQVISYVKSAISSLRAANKKHCGAT